MTFEERLNEIEIFFNRVVDLPNRIMKAESWPDKEAAWQEPDGFKTKDILWLISELRKHHELVREAIPWFGICIGDQLGTVMHDDVRSWIAKAKEAVKE